MRRSSMRLGAVFVAALALSGIVGCSSSETAAPPSLSPTQDASSATPTAAVTATAEREAILDALQPAVESEIGQSVSFTLSHVWTGGPYALVNVVVKRADGGEIDWASIPKFATAFEAGAFDPSAEALLRKSADGWEVIEVRIGATDTKRDAWRSEYNIPAWTALEE